MLKLLCNTGQHIYIYLDLITVGSNKTGHIICSIIVGEGEFTCNAKQDACRTGSRTAPVIGHDLRTITTEDLAAVKIEATVKDLNIGNTCAVSYTNDLRAGIGHIISMV